MIKYYYFKKYKFLGGAYAWEQHTRIKRNKQIDKYENLNLYDSALNLMHY